jgi:hypothetical protein
MTWITCYLIDNKMFIDDNVLHVTWLTYMIHMTLNLSCYLIDKYDWWHALHVTWLTIRLAIHELHVTWLTIDSWTWNTCCLIDNMIDKMHNTCYLIDNMIDDMNYMLLDRQYDWWYELHVTWLDNMIDDISYMSTWLTIWSLTWITFYLRANIIVDAK